MRTSQQASTTNAIAAVNAGFFNTVLCTSDSMMKENGELRASNPRQAPRTTFGWSASADGRIENPLIRQIFFDDPWDEVDSALGGGPTIVRNGEVYVTRDEEPLDPGYGASPKPCSAIALTSDDHLLFVTVDGRVGGLRGLSLEEMGKRVEGEEREGEEGRRGRGKFREVGLGR
jgi:exopolysaccharide biosynthesis protein